MFAQKSLGKTYFLFTLFFTFLFSLSSCAKKTVSQGTSVFEDKVPVEARVTNKYTQDTGGTMKYFTVLYYFASPEVPDSEKNTNGTNEDLEDVLEDIGEGIKNTGKEVGRTDNLTSTSVEVTKNQYDNLNIGKNVAIYYSTENRKNISFR
ncbi:hypothetical protein Fleli_0829 [Bernardetia litoralis DSM 6794]|uniref:Lipoprotein n=1 Tax=Bernardetia litoralis (strain ATCC 23117 / DSM 6794 / NBRC 15988 / NCIMB 1366 / Fx l1 / Sio-4) TaxID=880071 RepID=I4AH52_BERLS|nr:hypothetical protein [Bernardetia litoralis]AFM03287.1 hypothetical protein Fleli_0829 [Bernardetia litoralis DSM 6794]